MNFIMAQISPRREANNTDLEDDDVIGESNFTETIDGAWETPESEDVSSTTFPKDDDDMNLTQSSE